MPKLKCQVEQCVYNYDWLCAKNYIDVDGPTAKCKSDTLCRSYICKDASSDKYEFATLDGKLPNIITEVYCDATNCVFEKGQRCYADRIEIKNINGKLKVQTEDAKHQDVTSCQTFECVDCD